MENLSQMYLESIIIKVLIALVTCLVNNAQSWTQKSLQNYINIQDHCILYMKLNVELHKKNDKIDI
ncbi:hypothetical protein IEQ34_022880 [Dendrobium chrysotoxum]|uniref:Uncharacterized protein n=1 Tax=Dendrobium chrysotoxum TaxID=161865 RepID=A0AAV7FYQ2_DENCH|nr:hypothetical protein IEQ34_022880 [Dendrobium chrysotoxum]